MDPFSLPLSEVANAAAYRFVHERIMDRLLNLGAEKNRHMDSDGRFFFEVQEIAAVVSDYAEQMHLAIRENGLAYEALRESVKDSVQMASISEEGVVNIDSTDWEDGLRIAAQAFFEPIKEQLLKEGSANGGYFNVKNSPLFFAPTLHQMATHLYGEG